MENILTLLMAWGISVDFLVSVLRGRKGGLRPSKPTAQYRRLDSLDANGRHVYETVKGNGLVAYVWRMARFHSGADMTMPMMCYFDLQNFLDANGHSDIKVSGILNEQGKALTDALEKLTDEALTQLGHDNTVGARRWGRALGYL